jgi:hypothetical protein
LGVVVSDKVKSLEARIIRAGISILSILGFLAYFAHEVWRIISGFFH